ncbi:MAG TPA: RidA family protein [Anaerolineales bacterium]|nr:RidA family protein [Anaerolineales bacterium]
MSTKRIITTDKAPRAIGPYSVGVQVGEFLFTAGQVGIDPQTGEIVGGGIEAETRQVLGNLRSILEAAGTGMDQVIKTTVFLRDMNDFTRMNTVYAEAFSQDFPARTTIQAVALPKGAAVEIEAVALIRST